MTDRITEIENRLRNSIEPTELQIKDQSHLHAGHAGARNGRGHFAVTIVSDKFAGAGRLQRHKMVYDALGDLLETDIHAVRIKALTTDER